MVGKARPVVAELRPLLHDLRPVVDQLVPTAREATATLDNIEGPVMNRLKGPVKTTVTSSWHGTGYYEGNGNDHKFYEEVGYLAARAANLSQYGDKNGSLVALALGVGVSSIGGIDISLVDYLRAMGTVPPGVAAAVSPGTPSPGGTGPARSESVGGQPVAPGLALLDSLINDNGR